MTESAERHVEQTTEINHRNGEQKIKNISHKFVA